MLILIMVYAVSLCVTVVTGYFVLMQDTIRESEEKTAIFFAAMKGSRKYLKDVIRPKIKENIPDTFLPEGTVGIFMLSSISKFVQNEYPEYIYKISSPNPLNQNNMSNGFEMLTIKKFSDEKIDRWNGFIKKGGKRFYAVATPVVAEKNCIWCHDRPETANPQMVARYGTTSGYGYKLGDIVGGTFVYVPADVAIRQAMKKLLYFSVGFSIFFLLALVVVDRIIVRSVVKPIEVFVKTAEDVSRGKLDREFQVRTNDEMKALANAFNRMTVSIKKAIEIMKNK
jgi:methyl-accepting chemotaxis protein